MLPIMARKSMNDSLVLKMPGSRAKTTSLNYIHFHVDDVIFYDSPRMRIRKVKKVVHQQHVNCLINTWVFAG